MVPRKAGLAVVVALFLLLLTAYRSPEITAAVQKGFVLDLDSPRLMFDESAFNDTNTYEEHDYTGSGNVTYWVRIPKNSTVDYFHMNVTGVMTPVYTKVVNSLGIRGLSVGNVTSHTGSEIVAGTYGAESLVRLLYGENGTLIWSVSLGGSYDVLATDVGNITNDPGDEIVARTGDVNNTIYVINCDDTGGSVAWSFNVSAGSSNAVDSLEIGDLEGDGINEIITADSSAVYAYGDDQALVWNASGFSGINGIALGNVNSSAGNETVVGTSSHVYVLNSTGSVIWSKSLSNIYSVGAGNITSDQDDEIVLGTDSKIILLNSSGDELWNYSTGSIVRDVAIDDSTGDYPGNEIVAGLNNGDILTLDSGGGLIWSYQTGKIVRAVAIGNVTGDTGNEILAGDVPPPSNGNLYVFNFDYFPSNLSIDVGSNGTYEWSYSGPIRDIQEVTVLEGDLQYQLGVCPGGICNVSMLFHSDGPGRLNVSGLNVSYSYNISSIVSYTNLTSTWSRTGGVMVNESVGYEVRNVSFIGNPVQDVYVAYIKIDSSATSCDFNGSSHQSVTVGPDNACDIENFTIASSGALPQPFYLWDDSMASAIPVIGNETGSYYTNQTDSFVGMKYLNIWNQTPTTFYNITANTTIDDPLVVGMLFLNVTWSGQQCNITPQADTACTQGSPGYSAFSCGSDTFYACRNGNFFMWVQPSTTGSIVQYRAGGATNLPPNVSYMNVTLNISPWGDWFNYSVLINDTDGDNVSVTLWYRLEQSGYWQNGSTVNITGNGTAWFNMTSDSSWLGTGSYKFQYQDINSSGYPMHSAANTSVVWGPLARRHNTEAFHAKGNESAVNRSESVELVLRINDTDNGTWVSNGVSCVVWVTYNDSNFDEGHFNETNLSGYCTVWFTPDGNYSTGNHTWKGGVQDIDTYYNDSNSTNLVLTVNGRVNVTILEPDEGGVIYRNSSNTLAAKLVDQYGLDVNSSGFNCTFWFNNSYINFSLTNNTGHCNISWTPGCSYLREDGILNVTLSDPTGSYLILNNMDWRNVSMQDELNITISEPPEDSLFHRGESVSFNSTVNDTCLLCGQDDYYVNWSLKWKRLLEVTVNKTPGYEGQRFPVIINASYLEDQNIDISDWPINYTRVLLGGAEVQSRVNAWTDENKTEISWSQEYFNGYSELVFLAEQDDWENLTYEVVYNRSDSQEEFAYLENSGFESGRVPPWGCFSSNCTGQYCWCEIGHDGGEIGGIYSLYLSSEDTGSAYPSVQGASIYSGRPLGQDRLKIRYKPVGEFVNDAYIRLYAGQGMCELSTATDSWHEDTCYNTSFSSAVWVNITVHDNGSGGGESNAARVYIDYVCIANSSGDCVNYHSGYAHPVSSVSQTQIGYPDNMTWQIPLNESLGLRKVAANASGDHYKQDVGNVHIYIYGWSNLTVGNISSTNCTYNSTWICRQNASMDVFCFVQDANSSAWVEGHNVSFWGDGIYIGSNATGPDGMAVLGWENSSDSEGNHTITCNITDDPDVFYNATAENSAEMYFNVSSGNTTGMVNVSISPATPAQNLTKSLNRTYYLDINITNTGASESMYDIIVEITTATGVYAEPVSCPPLPPSQECDRTSLINVTYLATQGYKDIYVNVTWTNSDMSAGNASNATGITVVNNTALNIIESEVNRTIPRGGSVTAGNFTVESFGNTDLLSVAFSLSGNNASEISGWNLAYTPSPPIGLIPHAGQQLVNISVEVPDNATEGLYTATITADATGSACSPAGLCWDNITLNLNVTMPDWGVSTTQLNKTIGLLPVNGTIGIIQVTNNKDAAWSFNVAMDSQANGTGNITASSSQFSLTPFSTFSLYVYHNTTEEYESGLYVANITIGNNENAVPHSINVSVSLNVINFSIAILSPNQTSPLSDVVAGDVLNITANATLSGSPVDQNITWYVRVGGSLCGNLQSAYNSSDHLWYMNCSAPSLAGNPINNSLNITGYYYSEGVSLSVIEDDLVIYRDITPPQIGSIWVYGADSEGDVENATKSEIVIRASVTDNTGVNASWAMLYYQGSHQANYSMYEQSGYWTFNFSSPINVGDYRIVVYANDSAGNRNDTSSLVMGYFDVYLPLNLNGTLVNKDGTPISATFTFYKNDTLWEIHNFSTNGTGGYNRVLHRRFYDIKVGFLGNEIFFSDVDINASAVNQHGVQNPQNFSSPITLDLFTSENTTQIGVTLPDGAENPIMIVAFEHNLTRSNSSTYLSLDYTKALQDFYTYVGGAVITESDLAVYRCAAWNMTHRTCTGGFQDASISPDIDATDNRISFITTGSSAYAVAERVGTGDENGDGGDGTGDDTRGGSSGSSSYGGTTTTSTLPFTVTTSIGSIRIHPGENNTYLFSVRNKGTGNLTVSIDVEGLEEFIFPEKAIMEIPYNSSETMDIVVSVPDTMGTGTYTGSILVTAGGKTQEIPITMTVSIEAKDLVSLSIDVLTPNVNPGNKLRFNTELRNLGLPPGFDVTLVYTVKESEMERVVFELNETVYLEDSLMLSKYIDIGEENPIGQYYLEVWAYFGDGKSVNEVVVFSLVEPYWSSWEGRIILLILSMIGMGIIGYYGWRRYRAWKLEKSRYIFPLDFGKIPREGRDSFWVGKIADTDRKAWLNPADLTTHLLIAGSTGAGKSVSASVIVEEALDRNVPVVVFDPTAQWTGFVKALEDENLLRYYSIFGMNPKSVRPFKGMIFEVNKPQDLIFEIRPSFKKYLNPGEITVFTLDKLKPGQYDEAVGIIIDSLFSMPWEESSTLRVLVVFDEVHRLLEKYGGKGGYLSLEKAAREFRKWGIGIIMCSQVLADFKEAIAGNVLTEVQLNTKSITDIQKVETKYGGDYAKKISRQGVGVGMIQNPKYNDGKPYFVHFRPTWHNPHKISNEDMALYREFAEKLKQIETRIEEMKAAGRDTFDIELELKLAKDKLKQGRFRMAQIYITSLEQHLGKG